MCKKETKVRKKMLTFVMLLIGLLGITAIVDAQSGEKFVLTGVVYVEGGRGMAWLQEPTFTNSQTVTLRLGDQVGPYRLTEILEDQVELEGPGGKVVVPLAGTGGAISVAAIPAVPANADSTSHELPPHPALNNPDAIVVARGDASRNFPSSDLLIGAGADLAPSIGRQAPASGQFVAAPPPILDRGVVPSAMQKLPGDQPSHPALQNPTATVAPRGDPSRNFPAASLLIGAGAQTSGGK